MTRSVVLLTMMFAPEPTGFSPMVTDLAGYLAQQGWNVTVITSFPQAPYWRVYDEYKGHVFRRETFGSVKVYRGRVYVPRAPRLGSMNTWKRVLFDSSYAAIGLLFTCGLARPDVVVAVSPPLQAALPAIALKFRWRSPTLLWIQDIVPDAAVSTGMMKQGPALRLARWLESLVYGKADLIGVISPGFVNNLTAKGVNPSKIVYLPNWADVSRYRSDIGGEEVRHELGYGPDDFVLVHAGSVAAKQCLENAVRAMRILVGEHNIHLLVVGDGNRLHGVKEEVNRLGVSRVRFLAPRTGMPYVELLRAANALLLSQCKGVTDMLIPSKLLSYLPSGRPVIAAINADSEAARFLAEAGCAIIVKPDEPAELAQGILRLRDEPELRATLAAAGVRYVESLDRHRVLPEFADTLYKLANEEVK